MSAHKARKCRLPLPPQRVYTWETVKMGYLHDCLIPKPLALRSKWLRWDLGPRGHIYGQKGPNNPWISPAGAKVAICVREGRTVLAEVAVEG